MADTKLKDTIIRDFRLTTLALKNKNTVYLLAVVIFFFGLSSYRNLPKELFPEVQIPTILVQTVYPGNSPLDIENLITRPIEKEVEGINGIKELTSNSIQDASLVIVEFNTNVNLEEALQDVKDAVDKAKSELPNDLLTDPSVSDIDFSEFPILNINLSGDYSVEELRVFAEYLEDRIESVNEVSKVNIKGINDREIQINVDLHQMESLGLSFFDVENAITAENVSISGGEIRIGEIRRSIRTVGEFRNVQEIGNIIIKHDDGNIVYLKDIAEIVNGYKEPTNFARLDGQPVVSVQIIKKSGENLLAATDNVFAIVEEARSSGAIPAAMKVSFTNDNSQMVRLQLSNLENSIIMGMILVIFVLFYFLGTRNALFVGLAIPASMFLSFLIIALIGFDVNMIVLFALILALGLLVDNAIVVVENIYRFVSRGYDPWEAARQAVGEVALPIIASTATTLAAFLPLAFWQSTTGEFMKYLPITLIIVLGSSLLVALVIVPVFSATFIKAGSMNDNTPKKKRAYILTAVFWGLAALFFLAGLNTPGNLMALFGFLVLMNALWFYKAERWFRDVFLVWLEDYYLRALKFALRKRNPWWFFGGTFVLLLGTIMFFGARNLNVLFFPGAEPKYINVIASLPVGSDIRATDALMLQVEEDIIETIGEERMSIVESVLTTVGSGDPEGFSTGDEANKALTTITFIDYQDRGGISTEQIEKDLGEALLYNYPGVQISLAQNEMGPPAGRPVNLEIVGEDFEQLVYLTDSISGYIERSGIQGLEGLKMDLETGKPEMIITINREKARRIGVSTVQIASMLRTALYGKEISDFKVGEEDYPIQLRLQDEYRYDMFSLLNQKVTMFDNGNTIQVPIMAVADIRFSSTYGAVNRKDMKRVITLYSNVLEGYNANAINGQLRGLMAQFDMPSGFTYQFTGEQQEMAESMSFLVRAMLIAVSLILIILVSQFNSVAKPLIIMASVVFSTIGVLGGLATFRMDIIVVMTGIGIISLAGIVVNNAIVLIDYIELVKNRKRKEMGLAEGTFLPIDVATEAVVTAGKTRLRPVLLTAITTILGLLPLATGFNINFATMLSDFDPQIYFGGDLVRFWGPISWTVIFGLTFATFLTLIIVPVMYRITIIIQKRLRQWFGKVEEALPTA